MAVYKMIRIRVHDADRCATYTRAASAALARHGGELLYQNERDAATRILVVRFPDAASSWAHYGDPEVQQALSTARGSFTRDIVALEGGS